MIVTVLAAGASPALGQSDSVAVFAESFEDGLEAWEEQRLDRRSSDFRVAVVAGNEVLAVNSEDAPPVSAIAIIVDTDDRRDDDRLVRRLRDVGLQGPVRTLRSPNSLGQTGSGSKKREPRSHHRCGASWFDGGESVPGRNRTCDLPGFEPWVDGTEHGPGLRHS